MIAVFADGMGEYFVDGLEDKFNKCTFFISLRNTFEFTIS